MKKHGLKTIVFIFLIAGVTSLISVAQENSFDKVVMLNGDERIGKVTEINADDIKFTHQNETLTYTFNKSEINKIQFASGRIEIINEVEKAGDTPSESSLQSHHNWVAVIPFSFIGGGGERDDKLEKKVQMDCYNVLRKFAAEFKIQDPTTTNALLIRNGIDDQTIGGFTPEEIAHILEVEYVILGNVTVNQTGSTSYHSSVSREKEEKEKKKLVNILINSGSTSTTNQFRTQVDMQIFNDMGQNIYTKSHDSFWQTEDAYEITLRYLIKRSPLYRK